MEPHCWWCKRGQNKRKGPEKRVPYLPILPFNGCPLLAVGPVEIGEGGVGVVLLFGPFLPPSILSSAWAGRSGESGLE